MTRRGTGSIGTVAVVLLLVGLAAGGWALWGDGSDAPHTQSVVYADPRLPSSAQSRETLVTPDGDVVLDSTGSLGVIAKARVLSDADLEVLMPSVATISMRVARSGELTRGTWLFSPPPGDDVAELTRSIDDLYRRSGYQPVPGQHAAVSALVLRSSDGQPRQTTYRAHYSTAGGTVRVEAFGPDDTAVAEAFKVLLDRQLKAAPALG
ncbi:hypothetical protein F0L68_09385 [Solihabitans fulvus]|uniref:Uncharacterized protein n=1 Tax=Solihabitans fulvus TaxID=1892852 RepID=A0A5B2XKQ8_9PSEU|nr:hypothetical protein [Solihabitans fulvus]KAA2263694.1 hypothetical protein F0L68_09385 [Solihabitans fulvus]